MQEVKVLSQDEDCPVEEENQISFLALDCSYPPPTTPSSFFEQFRRLQLIRRYGCRINHDCKSASSTNCDRRELPECESSIDILRKSRVQL